jgi:hypothetical protein
MADNRQARDPRLAALDSLVGVWVEHIDHPAMPDIPDGRVEYAWALNGRYLLQRSIIPKPEFPDSQSFIAPGDESGNYLEHYFDTRGVTRLYQMGLRDGIWKLWRIEQDFSPLDFCQRFEGRFSGDGNRIDERWEQSHDGGGHGRGADGVAQLAQLALDAAMAPARVLPRQPEDEGLDLGRDGRAAAGVPPPERPLAPDQLAVPAQDRLGLAEEHIAVELTPRADGQPGERGGQDGQGQPLPAREAGRAGALALQQAHLVP